VFNTIKNKILLYGKMIKFHHTVFALPFALSAMVMAYKNYTFSLSDTLWILLAMVGARSAAMGFNRIADAYFDLKNERTSAREIPSGLLSKKEALLFVLASSLLFIFSAAMLSRLCFYLSFPVLSFLFFYSYTKRFTAFCHIFLGIAISLAPIATYLALTDTLSWSIIFLALSLLTYIAGFDILYACQDIEFDRTQGLFSLPATLGPKKAMQISSGLHVATVFFLFLMYLTFDMHPVFLIFFALIAILLIIEHYLVKPHDLSRIHIAFFHINSVISVLLFTGVLVQGFFR
jgi:4-hydroxybenzoate polyprenyltransferase